MKKITILLSLIPVIISAIWLTGCKTESNNPLKTVSHVDLNKYLGKWYEISKYPNKFEKDMVGITAEYSLRKDGSIKVLNQGYLYTLDGKEKSATGKAYVADKNSGSKLRVSFFGPFFADYWVIALGDEYEYAVVSEPSRKYLWVLSRSAQMNDEKYNKIVTFLSENGFDTTKLVLTPQAVEKP
jgi:apolipoprotein D and lipocalin family protein